MCSKSHRLRKLASAVSKRSGISLQTLEVAIPAIFDEIRYQLAEGDQYVIIESFGTFASIIIPERQRHYVYGDVDEVRTLPPKRKIRFSPSTGMRHDVEAGRFDTARRSFELKAGDPKPRSRAGMLYTKGGPLHLKYARKNRRPSDPPEADPTGEGQNDS